MKKQKDQFKKFDKEIELSIKKLEKLQKAARKKRNSPSFREDRIKLVKDFYKGKSRGKLI